jgi:hypothetical protein
MQDAFFYRANVVPFIIGIFLMTFGVAFFGTFIQWGWVLSSYGVWAFFAGIFLALSLGITGFDAHLSNASPPFVSASGTNPQGDWTPVDVVLHDGPINPTVVTNANPKDKPLASSQVGRDSKGRRVPVQVVPLGGRNAMGIHIRAGGLGFLILRGNPVIPMGDAHRGEFYFTPRVFRPVSISDIEEEVVQTLRTFRKFVYGKSYIYELGTYGKGFVEWTWQNEDDIRAILDRPHQDSPIGQADATYFQGRYQMVLTENHSLRSSRRRDLDTIQSQSEVMAGATRKEANLYRGTGRPTPPAWQREEEKPQGDQ